MRIFVYGTLKQGYHNHDLLARHGAQLIETTHLSGFKMHSAIGFPVVFPSKDPEDKITGEVYEVSSECLDALDWLESEGIMYKRTEIPERGFSVYVGVVPFWLSRTNTPMSPKDGTYTW